MNPEVGLAQSSAQPMRDVDQIVAMLQQGVSPEELIQMGIPEALVIEAINVVTQAATQIQPEQAGLAGMVTGGMV